MSWGDAGGPSPVTHAEQLFIQNIAGLPYVLGDILYFDGTKLNRLPIGSSGNVLTVSSGLPIWGNSAGTVTSVSVSSANGVSGVIANPTTTPAITISLGAITPSSVNGNIFTTGSSTYTGTAGQTYTFPTTSATVARTDAANTFTGHQTIEGVTSTGATGTGLLVFATSPTLTTAVLGSSTATTQAQNDNSTKLATTAYVDLAVLGQNYKEAVRVATTANLVGLYANGSSGVGATFTYTATGVDTVDGVALALGDRILLKNQTSDFQNGIYTVTTAGALGVSGILTRATDANQSNEYKTGDSLFVTAGTTLTSTTWAYTGIDSPTMGTTSLTYVQVAGQGSFTGGNGITITGTSIAIDTIVTVDKNTVQTLTNKTLTSPTLTTPTLGVATATSINSLTITTSTGTLTMTNSKTLTVSDSTTLATNAITLGGGEVITFSASNALSLLTSGTTVITLPAVTDTVAVLGTAQTFTALNTFKQINWTNNAITASSNAATVPITHRLHTVTNSSAATLTITMTTTSAVDGQLVMVRILDFSGVAQTITWVNTENSTVSAPTTSNGSTTLFLTVGFIYNNATSKWRCIASS